MRISDWSSDVCSSDLGWKDQTPEFAHIHPPKSKPALHEQRGFFDQLSAINHLLILEFSKGTPATTTVWRSSTRNPCLAKKPSAERLTWADSFRSPRSSATPWTCCMSAIPTPRAGKSPDTKKGS